MSGGRGSVLLHFCWYIWMLWPEYTKIWSLEQEHMPPAFEEPGFHLGHNLHVEIRQSFSALALKCTVIFSCPYTFYDSLSCRRLRFSFFWKSVQKWKIVSCVFAFAGVMRQLLLIIFLWDKLHGYNGKLSHKPFQVYDLQLNAVLIHFMSRFVKPFFICHIWKGTGRCILAPTSEAGLRLRILWVWSRFPSTVVWANLTILVMLHI